MKTGGGPGGEEGRRANDPGYQRPVSPDNTPTDRHQLAEVASMCSQDSDREHPPTPGPGPPEEGAPLPKRAGGLPPESGMSVAFCPMHRRRIVIYLPTCQPEDPGSRDASVQVGVTCEDKATQWEEREEADPSLDKSSGANCKVRVSPLEPRRQVLEGLRNGDCGTRKAGAVEGRRERASVSHRSEPFLHS
ncbi:UNVERIFIED_CONTAM: hypothetical protein K2H54_005036 [Gekko kuhli]